MYNKLLIQKGCPRKIAATHLFHHKQQFLLFQHV